MKKLKSLFLALGISVLGASGLHAQDGNPQNGFIAFHEDFESATNVEPYPLPEGWEHLPTPDYPEDRWKAGYVSNGEQVFPGNSGQYYMHIAGGSVQHDAWAFSPAIPLEGGKEYAIRFSLITIGAGDNITTPILREELGLYIGSQANQASMTQEISLLHGANGNSWGVYTTEQTFIPAVSGAYHLGFHAASPAYTGGILIDDIFVYETSAPILSTRSVLDFGSFLDLAPAMSHAFQIQNAGQGDDLHLDLAGSSPEIAVSGLPLDIPAGTTDSVSVRIDVDQPGSYTGYFVIASSDPFRTGLDTIRVTAQVEEARLTKYHFEDFESGGPEGWSFSVGAANTSGGGIDGSRSFYGNTASGSQWVSTHCIALGEEPELSFFYKVEWGTFAGMMGESGTVPADIPMIDIEISKDFGLSWEKAWAMGPEADVQHNPSDAYQPLSLDLSAYAGDTAIFRFTFNSAGGIMKDLRFYMDNISMGTQYDDDLEASVLSGSTFLQPGQETSFQVQLVNRGKNTQDAYDIQLIDYLTGNVVGTAAGPLLEAGQSTRASLDWTAGESGTYSLQAIIDLDSDQDPDNDRTNILNVAVSYPEDTTLFVAGDSIVLNSGYPVNFYSYQCAIQSIYYANELSTTAGTIHSISYSYVFDADYLSEVFSVYIGETLKSDFSDGRFIDTASLTKVFEGSVHFPSEERTFVVPFQTPYEYHGGNLVVFMLKTGKEFVTGKNFLCSPGNVLRSISYSTIKSQIDPSALPEGNPSNLYPSLTINMAVNPNGSLQGIISDAQGPVREARVTIAGTAMNTYTDENGFYAFHQIAEGTYALQVSKHGYPDTTTAADIAITAGQTTARDIQIERLQTFPIKGRVSSNGQGVGQTYVSLTGYEDYSTYTDQEGNYLFPQVYGSEGFVYHIRVNNYYFDPVQDSIRVENTEMTKDFELQAKTLTVSCVSASKKDTERQVTLQWHAPLPEFRYDGGQQSSSLGFPGGHENSYFASVYRHKAVLHEISWYITSEGARQEAVFLNIFALDENGLPTTKALYTATVPNTCDAWTSHVLPTPLAVEGFCIALSCNGYLSIGTSQPTTHYPFERGMHYYNSRAPIEVHFMDMAEFETSHLMIRASGEDLGVIEYPQDSKDNGTQRQPAIESDNTSQTKDSPVESYTLYRFAEGQPQEEWTLVGATEDTVFTDKDVYNLAENTYQWAVVANYAGGESTAKLSNPLLIQDVAKETEAVAQGIGLYPNPFTDNVCLNNASAIRSIQVIDMMGKTVKRIEKLSSQVGTQDLTPGLYFWIIETQEGKVRTFKMIKE